MTAPKIDYHKFWIVKPYEQYNYIKNPTFASPDFEEDWAASGAGVTIAHSGDYQRRGAYSMKVNTASGVASGAYYANLSVTNGVTYAFSCDVLGVAGQAMRIFISDAANNIKATTTFTATGYWQRESVSFTAAETATTYYVAVSRDAVASTAAYYVDGAQFEHWKATTFFDGYTKGCRWTGAVRNSTSYRPADTAAGGELVDLDDYCHFVYAIGLGHGDWNQILTKMTSGGDMYQTHIRKSRNFSIVVDFVGSSINEIEANRKAIIDAIRPDLAPGQERIIRYQGLDINGQEATQPVDIVCVPLPATLTDIPELPTYQRAILNFTIPSGLLQGAYNEGKELDLYADFPAEYIVKRDKDGNWCKWNGSAYASLITGLNGDVYCMAEGPDGKIYVGGRFTDAGGVTDADYLARWNPVSEAWEAIGTPNTGTASITNIFAIVFDASGNLYVGGAFADFAGIADADYFAKWDGTNWTALGSGISGGAVNSIAISGDGTIYIGGSFTTAGGDADCNYIAYYDVATSNWKPIGTAGLNQGVNAFAFAPNGDLYIGGAFTDVFGASANTYTRICKWNGSSFSAVGSSGDLNSNILDMAFGATGHLYVGGQFTNAGGIADADYIAKWNGNRWESLGSGLNANAHKIVVNSGKVYVGGTFTTAGGLTLPDRVAVWSNGAWQPLDIDLPGTSQVNAILPASDGSLYIGGAFSTAGETPDVNAETGIVALNLNVTSASANTYPFMQIHGPGTLKAITNYTTGKSVMFDGLTLQAGEWINLSFDPLNLQFKGGWEGRGNLMRYIVPGSDYGDFYLKPGGNALSLFMTDTDANTNAFIHWTPLFWGLDGALL